MIPKTIHCIWLGGKSIPVGIQENINSWLKVLPDYKVRVWTEKEIPLKQLCRKNKFLNECYKRKLWAFVSDYIRLWVLNKYGGIYLDTDVEVVKSFDPLLTTSGFIGYEAGVEKYGEYIGSGIIGSEKENKSIKKLLDFYEKDIWNEKEYVNTIIFKKLYRKDPTIFNDLKLYSRDFFSPYSPYDSKFKELNYKTRNTYTIHWYNSNWGVSLSGYVFLTTKYEKNRLKRNILKLKRIIGYLRKKILSRKSQ